MAGSHSSILNGAILASCLYASTGLLWAAEAPHIDFDHDVRPILAENCLTCHGFDPAKRSAGLRLDVATAATRLLPSGKTAIVPGKPTASELIERVSTAGPQHMPPAYSGKQIRPDQVEILRRWISQGARYEKHWAFVAPRRPALPTVRNAAWVRNPIDRFILARLEKEGVQPSPEADRGTLIRRLSLDLTGLPPTVPELDAFLADQRPDAYERLVDRLLASPHFGERMALPWLDLARYADTHGYHMDSGREMWRWRDWVIDAFNRNMPYDRFVVEQLAGDLLPHATLQQKIATGFNRNHPITLEGGAVPEEYAAQYIFDRIDTTATTFMGLTMRCAQCHDHKYDPITQKDFYRFFAFFHNVPENGLDGATGNAVPFLKSPTPEQDVKLKWESSQLTALKQGVRARLADTLAERRAWESTAIQTPTPAISRGLVARFRLNETSGTVVHSDDGNGVGKVVGTAEWVPGNAVRALQFEGNTHVELGDVAGFDRTDAFSYGAWINPTTTEAMAVMSRMDDAADFRGWDLFVNEGKIYVHIIHKWDTDAIRVNTKMAVELKKWTHVFATYDGSGKAKGVSVYLNGKPVELEVTHDTLTGTIKTYKPLRIGSRNPGSSFHGSISDVRIYNRALDAAEVLQLGGIESIRQVLAIKPNKRTADQEDTLARFYLQANDPVYRKRAASLAWWQQKYNELDRSIPTTMVMEEMPKPRETHILIRGAYDKPGAIVTAGVPEILPPIPSGLPANRLGLARWLVDPSHPLTARVAVNRYWQMYFGSGLVRTSENFGTQGDRPTHPELLDWMATEFIRTGWNVRAMQRLIVTSAAYRQSSRVSPALLEKDPENRLMARGPRFRMPAETVRDQALALSGLLVPAIGGASVKPYQPAGLWEELSAGGNFSEQKYVQDHGDKLYRRSLYTFWKRTCPPPSLQTFDAPEREFCMVRRSVTNTPLQALVLMNDPTYVEASRKFAERILTEAPPSPADRITYAFRMAMARSPHEDESKVLLGMYRDARARYYKDHAAAYRLLKVGESRCSPKLDPAEIAAWSTVTSVILNLDETITRN